ncbi:hypothetical protein HG530_013402 [Fusarium avenaceum]|nr:hypothetical protein HG530_013402 [Fusarium avenaceum]
MVAKSLAGIGVDLLLGDLAELHLLGAVHLLANGLEALVNGTLQIVGQLQVLGLVGSRDDTMGEVNSPLTTLSPVVGQDGVLSTGRDSLLAENRNLSVRVSRKLVDSNNDGDTERLGVGNLLLQVHAASAQNVNILLLVDRAKSGTRSDRRGATVNLESSDGSNNDNDVRSKARSTALDIEESFTSHSEVETSLGNNESRLLAKILIRLGTGEFQRKLVGKDRALSNADVGERTSMHKYRSTLEGLHQVGLDGILHESSEGTASTDVVGCDGVAAS